MTSVDVPVAALPSLPVPGICARTGRAAVRLKRLTIQRTPWWALFGLAGGLLAVALLGSTGRRCDVRLPIAKRVEGRRTLFAVGTLAALFLAMFGAMAAVTAPHVGTCAFAAVTVAATGACWWRWATGWVGGRWVSETHVRLTRLHPAFAAELGRLLAEHADAERRRALTGWHPDPAGSGGLRWFDGSRWTDHLAPAS